MKILVVTDEVVVGLTLPERNDLFGQPLVDFMRRERFPTVQDIAQSVAGHRPDDDVNMVRHDRPCAQLITLVFKKSNCSRYKIGEVGLAQMARAVAGIEVFVHATRIPAKQFLLLTLGERTLGGFRLMHDCLAFCFESQQDFLGQRTRLTKRDEISATLVLQVRQHTARMESRKEMVWRIMVRHGSSAGVPACGLWRRPAASSRDTHRDGAGTRSRGRLR